MSSNGGQYEVIIPNEQRKPTVLIGQAASVAGNVRIRACLLSFDELGNVVPVPVFQKVNMVHLTQDRDVASLLVELVSDLIGDLRCAKFENRIVVHGKVLE